MNRFTKALLWTLLSIVAIAGLGYAFRRPLLLSFMSWELDHRHPVGPNHPVPWADGPAAPAAAAQNRPPNIVLILADDLGFNDVSFFGGGVAGGTVPTPAIDSIGHDGVAFPVAYSAAPVCAPSRAAVLTARYATRSGFEFTPTPKQMAQVFELFAGTDPRPKRPIMDKEAAKAAPEMDDECLPGSEITMAEALKARGYHTVHIGKWHLGGKPGSSPNDQGFDESLQLEGSLYSPRGTNEIYNARHPRDPIDVTLWGVAQHAVSFNHGPRFAPNGYLTDYFTDEAVSVIKKNRNQPFFLYLAHWAVHVPMQASQEDYEALPQIQDHGLRVHAAMVRSLDRSVRRVLAALKENGLEDNTLVVFTSDNGGPDYVGLPELNKPYRGWKLTMFEGGTHVPHFLKWPGHITPGSTYSSPVSHLDIMPTAVAAAGAKMPTDRIIDGTDLLPYLTQAKPGRPHDILFWREGYYQAVRSGDFKLQVSKNPRKVWLYDLGADPTEKVNLADKRPDKVAEIQNLLQTWNKEQAPPMWPYIAEMPLYIDKTIDDPVTEGDEYIYWPN